MLDTSPTLQPAYARPAGNTGTRRVALLFFGRLAERLGRAHHLDLPEGDHEVAALRRSLAARGAQWADALGAPGVRVCVDGVIVPETAAVRPAREIAFIPPLSGG